MTTSKAVRHAFSKIPDQSSLGVFVNFAIQGVGDDPAFGGNRLSDATEQHGRAAARQLLEHLRGLPAIANCTTREEFVIGYVPASKQQGQDDLARWDALQGDAFSLMMADPQADPYELGKKLIAAIRKVADFASARLSAWGVSPE